MNFLGAAGDVPLNAIVRLRGGQACLPAFRAERARSTRGSGLLLALIPGHRAARLHAGPLLRKE